MLDYYCPLYIWEQTDEIWIEIKTLISRRYICRCLLHNVIYPFQASVLGPQCVPTELSYSSDNEHISWDSSGGVEIHTQTTHSSPMRLTYGMSNWVPIWCINVLFLFTFIFIHNLVCRAWKHIVIHTYTCHSSCNIMKIVSFTNTHTKKEIQAWYHMTQYLIPIDNNMLKRPQMSNDIMA